MFGMLEEGLNQFIPDQIIHELTLYFGNIDIRHHLCRYDLDATEDLVRDYFDQINYIRDFKNIKKVNVVLPLPIEHIDRKIPKTGYYKGTPYYGTWLERHLIRNKMAKLMYHIAYDSDINILSWPDWYKNLAHELTFDVMEKPKSVHLSPEYYYWDLTTNRKNPNYYNNPAQRSLFDE